MDRFPDRYFILRLTLYIAVVSVCDGTGSSQLHFSAVSRAPLLPKQNPNCLVFEFLTLHFISDLFKLPVLSVSSVVHWSQFNANGKTLVLSNLAKLALKIFYGDGD